MKYAISFLVGAGLAALAFFAYTKMKKDEDSTSDSSME